MKRDKETLIFVLISIAVVVLWYKWRYLLGWFIGGIESFQMSQSDSLLEHSGQLGDSYGSLSALFSALAFAGVIWTGAMQRRDLEETTKTQQRQQDQLAKQAFESNFFRLLQLSRDITEQIEDPKTDKRAARALDYWAASIISSEPLKVSQLFEESIPESSTPLSVLGTAVAVYEVRIYGEHQSMLGPYFRSLFQTFRYIHEAPRELFSAKEKIQYANIARGQISGGAVLLLALSGLTDKGERFVPLIEEYGLLEHMHRQYFLRLQSAFATSYQPRAFLGSKEREKVPRTELPVTRRQMRDTVEAAIGLEK